MVNYVDRPRRLLLYGDAIDTMPPREYLDFLTKLGRAGIGVVEMHERERVKPTSRLDLIKFGEEAGFTTRLVSLVWNKLNNYYTKGQREMTSYIEKDNLGLWRRTYGPLIILENPNPDVFGDEPRVIDTLSLISTVDWMKNNKDRHAYYGVPSIGTEAYSLLEQYCETKLSHLRPLVEPLPPDYVVDH